MTDSKEVAVVDAGSGLARLALEGGHPVEVLERVLAMEERISDRNARVAFVEALTAFRDQCPQIEKTRENTQFTVTRGGVKRNSTYAPLEDIDKVARPVAAKHGLVWTWDTRVDETLMHVTCKVLHVMGHSESSTVSMPYESKAGSSPQQKYGSTQTYGMRYSLIAAMGITTADEDTDGNAAQPETISDGQAKFVKGLLKSSGADVKKFLAWLGIGSVEEMTQNDFPRAVKNLELKEAQANKVAE